MNPLENANAVVPHQHLGICGGFDHLDKYRLALGVVNGVVEHFREAVVPDILDVVRQLPECFRYVVRPYDVLGQAGDDNPLSATDGSVNVPIGRRANRTVMAVLFYSQQRVINPEGAPAFLAHRPKLRNGLA